MTIREKLKDICYSDRPRVHMKGMSWLIAEGTKEDFEDLVKGDFGWIKQLPGIDICVKHTKTDSKLEKVFLDRGFERIPEDVLSMKI